MTTIDLIQPRNTYASDIQSGQLGHIYTNTSLRTIGSLLDGHNDQRIIFHDENIKKAEITGNIVGINLLGAPYIPETIKLIERIRNEVDQNMNFILGGQVVRPGARGLTNDQRKKLFGPNVHNGMDSTTLAALGIGWSGSDVSSSLVPVYEKLSDEEFLLYFWDEISLFVSKGCIQNCSFCAAEKGQAEQYRDADIIRDDVEYIVSRLEKLGKNKLDIYMSNLDVFQTPAQLSLFISAIEDVKRSHPGFVFSLRGLAGVSYFMKLHEKNPELLCRLKDIGFNTVGYGVDGMGEEVWKRIKKPQNNQANTLGAIELTRTAYDMTPELLMVFGHEGIDTEKTLSDAYAFTEHMVDKYRAVPRPHIAKPFIPGNDGWHDAKYADKVQMLMKDPTLFQALDFTAMANKLTHNDDRLIALTNEYYYKMCMLPGNTTRPIIAYNPDDSATLKINKDHRNMGKFDR